MVWDWSIDGWIVAAGALCAIASSLLGNFLVLRRLSLMGDAISHSVLPGIAAAFLFSGTRGSVFVLIGAAAMGLVTVWVTELIRYYGKVEESAAIGVVFTTLFAIGLVMMVRAGDKIDLDPSCVLYGSLETVILNDSVLTPLCAVPRLVVSLGIVCLINVLAIVVFYKQWQISTFDPLLSQAQGVPSVFFHYLLASLVAVTCIASFEAVGNILVVAMLVVPAATSYLLCKRLHVMILVSALVGAFSAFFGHLFAVSIPNAMEFRSVNSAAMMAVASGLFLLIAVIASPKAGLLVRWLEHRSIERKIVGEDVLALLYRQSERAQTRTPRVDGTIGLATHELAGQLHLPRQKLSSIVKDLSRAGWVREDPSAGNSLMTLTDEGFKLAQNLIRSHRLWEQYLSVEMNASDARLHAQAESLEHFTSPALRDKLNVETGQSSLDPHGRTIPPEG